MKLKILLAASECVPFCKTGGLADVVGALALELRPYANELVLILPKYKAIAQDKWKLTPVPGQFLIPIGAKLESCHLWETTLNIKKRQKTRVYFVEHEGYFNREGLYRTPQGEYSDSAQRFIFFSRAVLEACKFIDFKPDVIHCHDWQTALVPAYLKTLYKIDAFFRQTATTLTIHNLAYQGAFPKETMDLAGLPYSDFTMDKFEFYGQMNFLKAGLTHAQVLTTVSPTYAKEIQQDPQKGCGLEGVLRKRSQDLFGVLNGLDLDTWDPLKDPYLSARYNHHPAIKSSQAKTACKLALQKEVGLPQNPTIPVLGMVSRLDQQKGIDLLVEALPNILQHAKAQVVILGTGEKTYHDKLENLMKTYPQQLKAILGFNDPLAHRIYAGSDFFLMPSRYEPCGLSQMIAMRYGSLPIVTKTGGLADTVTKDNGFICQDMTKEAYQKTIALALDTYQEPAKLQQLIANAKQTTFAWERSIQEYLRLYKLALQKLV